MKALTPSLGAAALLLILSACATQTTPVALAPVGPEPARTAPLAGSGTLQVFTAFEATPPGPSDPGYRRYHTSYRLSEASGQFIRVVRNRAGGSGEDPTLISLPPGHYMVEAQANGIRDVKVPVTIAANEPTVVHLDGVVDSKATAAR